jgi:hypothetical protein
MCSEVLLNLYVCYIFLIYLGIFLFFSVFMMFVVSIVLPYVLPNPPYMAGISRIILIIYNCLYVLIISDVNYSASLPYVFQ